MLRDAPRLRERLLQTIEMRFSVFKLSGLHAANWTALTNHLHVIKSVAEAARLKNLAFFFHWLRKWKKKTTTQVSSCVFSALLTVRGLLVSS